MERSGPLRSRPAPLRAAGVLAICVAAAAVCWLGIWFVLVLRAEPPKAHTTPIDAHEPDADQVPRLLTADQSSKGNARTVLSTIPDQDQPEAGIEVFGDVTGQGLLSESELAFAREILGGWQEQSEFLATNASAKVRDESDADPFDELEEARLLYQAEAGRNLLDAVSRGFYYLEEVGRDRKLQVTWLSTAFVLRIGVRENVDLVVGVPHSEYEGVQDSWDYYQAVMRVKLSEIADEFNRRPFDERARILSNRTEATRYRSRGMKIHWPTRTLRVVDG